MDHDARGTQPATDVQYYRAYFSLPVSMDCGNVHHQLSFFFRFNSQSRLKYQGVPREEIRGSFPSPLGLVWLQGPNNPGNQFPTRYFPGRPGSLPIRGKTRPFPGAVW
jgi:hypothetical protein